MAPSQIEDLATIYPALTQEIRQTAIELLVARRAESERWCLDRTRDQLMRALLGMPARQAGIGEQVQALYASTEAAAPTPAAARAGTAPLKTSMGTPGQQDHSAD
jgi:hypothetical protein